MFVTTIVTGAVSIYKPFTLTKRPFMRDIIFYIFAVYLTFYVLWTNTVKLYQAIGRRLWEGGGVPMGRGWGAYGKGRGACGKGGVPVGRAGCLWEGSGARAYDMSQLGLCILHACIS